MGKHSRDKGKRGEREAAALITRLFGVEAHRGRQYQGSDDSPDVKADLPGVHWEVKRTEALSLYPAIEQAAADAADSVPVVLHRRNGKPWLCVVRADDLPALVVKLYLAMAENV